MRILLSITLPSVLVASSTAQSALMREGDAAPSGVAGQVVSAVANSATNQANGYAFRYTTDGPAGLIQGFFGNLTGGPGATLREEATIGTLTQTAYEFNLGLNSSSLVYSANCDDASGATSLDSVWIDDVPVIVENDVLPGTTFFLVNASAPRITEGGVPTYVANYSLTGTSSSTDGELLYMGSTSLLGSGSTLPNLPVELDTFSVSDNYRFSSMGSHYIVEVQLLAPSSEDGAIVVDGSGLMLGGSVVREGVLMPVSVGGDGIEFWDNLDFTDINEAGDFIFTGDTDGDSSLDEFIIRNGVAWAREGDVIDGQLISGGIEAAVLNERNEIAYVWDVDDGSGTALEALFFERRIVVKEGDEVDWDGDGVVDPGVVLTDFTGTNSISMTEEGVIYFSADCDVNGVTLEGLFVVDGRGPVGNNFCSGNPNSIGAVGTLSATGSSRFADNNITLSAAALPTQTFGFFLASQVQAFVMNPGGSEGNLCLGGNIGRYVGPGQVQNSGSSGEFMLQIDLTSIPTPSGPVSAAAGETWNFQVWHRDSVMGAPTSNFTVGLEVLLD